MVVHLVLGVRSRSTAMEDAEAVIPEPSSLAPSSSIDQPSRPVAIKAVLMEMVSFASEASLDVHGMVKILVEALVEDEFLLWWVTVTPHPLLRDICETLTPSWEADFDHVSFLALRAAVSTISGIGDEASLLTKHKEDVVYRKYSVGNWKTILYDEELSRTRMHNADFLIFDIWASIPKGWSPDNVDKIIHAAWSMCPTGQRHAFGWLGNLDQQHNCVAAALTKYGFTVHSLCSNGGYFSDGGYFNDVMTNFIFTCRDNPPPDKKLGWALTLFSGANPDGMPGLDEAIRSAINKDVQIILVAWRHNLNEAFKELAPAVSELRIMLLEEILLSKKLTLLS